MKSFAAKIIVIDDDCQFRNITVDVLHRRINDPIASFGSCADAWKHLQAHNEAEIILSDVNMPGMNGLELLRLVKREYPQKICILMSGDPTNEVLARKLGADAYISKPFQIKEISDLLQSFMTEVAYRYGGAERWQSCVSNGSLKLSHEG